MRKLKLAHTDIKPLVKELRKTVRIDVSENAGRSLTGGYGAHLGTRAAKGEPALCHKALRFGYFIKRYSDYLSRKSCGKYHLSVAEFFGTFGYCLKRVGGIYPRDGNNPSRKALSSLFKRNPLPFTLVISSFVKLIITSFHRARLTRAVSCDIIITLHIY